MSSQAGITAESNKFVTMRRTEFKGEIIVKVFFVGANGKVARHFADFVKNDSDIQEVAMIRNAEQAAFFKERGIETVLLDLIKNTVSELADAMRGSDVVIFSAGAGGSSPQQTVLIDLEGAVKTMAAAEEAGIKRFVMVSTFRTGREEMAKENALQTYTIAKNYADEWLKNRTQLDWTIVHPGILVNEAGIGKVSVGMGLEIAEVPRQDVAQTLLTVLRSDNTINKEFEVLGGSTPVVEAVQTI